MKQKLICVIMGQDCEKFLPMCLESINTADNILFIDGGSSDNTYNLCQKYNCHFITNEYNQEDKTMNGKQRNFYLKYLKEKYPNNWALCLDADEVVEDLSKIKNFIQEGVPGLYSIKMRHFHGDLGHEDATQKEHFVLNRLFKISEVGSYPEVEHPVLQPKIQVVPEGQELEQTFMGKFIGTTIWHLAHIQHCFEIKKRYEKNLKHSNMHTKDFLDNWYLQHLTGSYPNKQLNLVDVPEIIWNNFGIDKDVFYFMNRGVEMKHFILYKTWRNMFKQNEKFSVLDIGAGFGPYGYVANYHGDNYTGVELSNYAVKTNPYKLNLIQGNILTYNDNNQYDLVMLIDILEHLEKKDLEIALENMSKINTKFYLFSIPFRGDPNLEADKTHKIKMFKEQWLEILNKYFNIVDVPADWPFAQQMLIGVKK